MYKKLLVPLDTSEEAECVLPRVKETVAAYGIPEVVLFSVIGSTTEPYTLYLDEEGAKQALERVAQNAFQYLEKTKESLGLKKVEVSSVVWFGHPADAILDYSQSNDIDLIIMSTHGRSGVSKWLIGSVAEKVLKSSSVPVLLVPALECKPSK